VQSPLRVLDLFCCAGGAAKGYQRVGAHVHGVDIVQRPNYCGEQFSLADALYQLEVMTTLGYINDYDLIHASPPCQAGCTITNGTNKARGWGRQHEQLVPATRELLDATGLPYVIEQPAGHGV
jgi:site-specific DNA-cytosine methylase